jgi:hypothetical protein
MKTNMWNPQTRRAMYRLLERHGIPKYSKWIGVMSPSLSGLVGSDFDHALDKVAHDMNLLYRSYLPPGKIYKGSAIKQQINFTLQQGIRAKGYKHRFIGQRTSCFENLQAAIAEGFINFEEIHETMHPFIISSKSGSSLNEVEKRFSGNSRLRRLGAIVASKALEYDVEDDVPPVIEDNILFCDNQAVAEEKNMKTFIENIRPLVSWRKASKGMGGHRLNPAPFAALWYSCHSAEELQAKYEAIIEDTVKQLKNYGVKKGDFKKYDWKYMRTKATREGCTKSVKPPTRKTALKKRNKFEQMISGTSFGVWAEQKEVLNNKDFWLKQQIETTP